MAIDVASSDPIEKVLEDLEAQKTLITNCTLLWKSLSDHFSSLRQTLADRSQALDADLQSIDSTTKQTLETLSSREASVPDREAAAAALIKERRDAAVAEIEDPAAASAAAAAAAPPPTDIRGILRWFCRRMDSAGLWRFMVSRRRDLGVLRFEIGEAVAGSVDPARVVVDAVGDYLGQLSGGGGGGGGGHDPKWVFGMLVMTLFDSDGKKAPEVSESMKERAAAVVEEWKEKLVIKGDAEGAAEGEEGSGRAAQIFLQMVAAFGLSSRFEEEFLRKVFLENAQRKEIARLAPMLGFGKILGELVEDLLKTGKDIEAVYIVTDCGLTEQFPPVSLLKSYLHASRKKAHAMLKNGNRSYAATEEASNIEYNAIKAVINCVQNCKLESQFSTNALKIKLFQMEKAKADRKKATAPKPPSVKRRRAASSSAGVSSFRAAKRSRSSNSAYGSYGHRRPSTGPRGPSSSYKYPPQVAPAPAYGAASHVQNPAAVSQQYYPVNYAGYDYAAPQSVPSQPSHPQ
ncbi:FRIGIDA-like protein 4a [Ananas comosus]|uniref:FRIGIDA-like protein n=1 Tax=Ananas comosus TaxID=4615 RepID=A0A199W9F0_ANACO|nr:FRIGIDA-like protein 4a [Ananas comosus]